MWCVGISALLMTLVTCHTGPPGVGASLKYYNADWSLFIRAESQSWLCSAPLPVCSGLSVIKRSEDFLAKIFLQRKHAGSKSRGRFWKFNQIWSPLSLWRPSLLPPPSLCCLGAGTRASSQPGLSWVNELKRLDHLADQWLYYHGPWKDLNQIVTN